MLRVPVIPQGPGSQCLPACDLLVINNVEDGRSDDAQHILADHIDVISLRVVKITEETDAWLVVDDVNHRDSGKCINEEMIIRNFRLCFPDEDM